jgi:hypothetical protein
MTAIDANCRVMALVKMIVSAYIHFKNREDIFVPSAISSFAVAMCWEQFRARLCAVRTIQAEAFVVVVGSSSIGSIRLH